MSFFGIQLLVQLNIHLPFCLIIVCPHLEYSVSLNYFNIEQDPERFSQKLSKALTEHERLYENKKTKNNSKSLREVLKGPKSP